MDTDQLKRLEKLERVTFENNTLLHEIHRSMRLSQYMTILYWIVLIGGAIGLYTFAKPFVDKTMDTYNQVQQVTKKIDTFSGSLFKIKQPLR